MNDAACFIPLKADALGAQKLSNRHSSGTGNAELKSILITKQKALRNSSLVPEQ